MRAHTSSGELQVSVRERQNRSRQSHDCWCCCRCCCCCSFACLLFLTVYTQYIHACHTTHWLCEFENPTQFNSVLSEWVSVWASEWVIRQPLHRFDEYVAVIYSFRLFFASTVFTLSLFSRVAAAATDVVCYVFICYYYIVFLLMLGSFGFFDFNLSDDGNKNV